jgi:hypothetical protein
MSPGGQTRGRHGRQRLSRRLNHHSRGPLATASAVFFLFLPGMLFGQMPPPEAPATNITPPAQPDCRNSPDSDLHGYPAACGVPTMSSAPRNGFVALDGTGVVPIGGGHPILFGATALGGYDSAFAGTANTPASFMGGGGYGAVLLAAPSAYFVLQNTINTVFYQVGNGTTQYFDNTALEASGAAIGSWSWDANVSNAVGNDALRVLTPLNTSNLGNLPVPSAETPAFAVQTGMVLDNDLSFAVQQTPPRRQVWRFVVRNSYRYIFDQHQADNTLNARAEFNVQASPRSNWGLYEETAHENGVILCTTQSVGFTSERQVMRHSVLQLSGGPAFGTKGCFTTITGVFYGAFTSEINHSLSLYASGSRKLNDSLLQQATWEDTAQGGFLSHLGPSTLFRVDVGFLRGTQPSAASNFISTFEGVKIDRQLGGGISFGFSVRHFDYSGATSTLPNRTQVLGTLTWSSARRSARTASEVTIQ